MEERGSASAAVKDTSARSKKKKANTGDDRKKYNEQARAEQETEQEDDDEGGDIVKEMLALEIGDIEQQEEGQGGAAQPRTGPTWEECDDELKARIIEAREYMGMIIGCSHSTDNGDSGRPIVPAADVLEQENIPCCARTNKFKQEWIEEAKGKGDLPEQILRLEEMRKDLGEEFYDQGLLGCLEYGVPLGYTGPMPTKKVYRNHKVKDEKGKKALEATLKKDLKGLPRARAEEGKEDNLTHSLLLGKTIEEAVQELKRLHPSLNDREAYYSCNPTGIVVLEFKKPRIVDDYSYKDGLNKHTHHLTLPQLKMTGHKSFKARVAAMKKKGIRVGVLQADVKSYFRHLRHSTETLPLVIYFQDGNYYTRLGAGFGSRVLPCMAARVSGAFVWTILREGVADAAMYCDDLNCLVDLDDEKQCEETERIVKEVAKRWNLIWAEDKWQMPNEREAEVLGLMYNLQDLTVHATQVRVHRSLAHCERALKAKGLKTKQWASAYYTLLSLSEVIEAGKAHLHFIRRAWMRSMKSRNGWQRVDTDAKYDLRFWVDALEMNKGTSLKYLFGEREEIQGWDSDACGKGGGAVDAEGRFFDFVYSKEELEAIGDLTRRNESSEEGQERITIACLEFHALIVALLTFERPEWRGKKIRARCDNMNVVDWIKQGQVKAESDPAAYCLRRLHLEMARMDIELEVEYVDTKANLLADLLSRNERPKFVEELTRVRNLSATLMNPPFVERNLFLLALFQKP